MLCGGDRGIERQPHAVHVLKVDPLVEKTDEKLDIKPRNDAPKSQERQPEEASEPTAAHMDQCDDSPEAIDELDDPTIMEYSRDGRYDPFNPAAMFNNHVLPREEEGSK